MNSRRITTSLGLVLLSCLGSLSCQSGEPSSPDAGVALRPLPGSGGVPVTVATLDLTVDLVSMTAEVTPIHEGQAIGDTYSELGLTPGFTKLFGQNFSVKALRKTGPTQVEIDLASAHPFTAAARPDLAIFNLKCYVVTDASAGLTSAGQTLAPGLLTNADGYGQMWSLTSQVPPAFANATLQPYVIFREDATAGTFNFQDPSGYNVYFPGQSSVDTLRLELGTATTLQARLLLTADYGQSAVRATRQTPAYELPKFAGNAPWKVTIEELSNDLQAGNTSSTASYQVDIWDWKHGQSLGSDVTGATLSVPGITTSPLTLSLTGGGTDPTPLTATALVTNLAGGLGGEYWGVVQVTDAAQGVGLKDDLTTPVSLTDYSTWQVFPVSVSDTALPPNAVANILNCDPSTIRLGMDVVADASASTPGDHPISTFEWDFDYDGSNFDVDATGVRAWRPCLAAGSFTIGLRVSDAFANSDIATTSITVSASPAAWQPAVRLTNDGREERFDWEGDESLAVGPDGTIYLTYLSFQSPARRIDQVSFGGCPVPSWSAPETIATATGGSDYMPSSLFDQNGDMHVMYYGTGNQWTHIRKNGGSWTAPVTVTSAPPQGFWFSAARMALNVDGRIGFAAVARPQGSLVCQGQPAPQSKMYLYEYNGTSWSSPDQFAGADTITAIGAGCGGYTAWIESLDIVSLANGDWLVMWEDLETPYVAADVPNWTQLGWIRQNSGVWGPEGNLYAATARAGEPRLARAPDGKIWAIFRRNDSMQLALTQYDGTSWSATPTIVMTVSGGFPRPTLEISPSGRGVLFASTAAGATQLRLKRFRHTDTPAMIAGYAIEEPQVTQPWARNYGGAVQAQDGRVVSFWRSAQWGTGTLYELEGTAWQ